MGLSVHYRGSLTDKKQIHNFIHELEDIAKSVNWEYRILDEDWSRPPDARLAHNSAGQAVIEGELGLKGIILSMHKDCESLNLCFKASGELASPLQIALSADEDYLGQPEWVSVKTQFAGPDVHVALVKLLRYLKGKYLHDLEVDDESGYWDTGDYNAIVKNISLINRAIDAISNQLENSDAETEDDIIAQIEKALRDLKDREEGR